MTAKTIPAMTKTLATAAESAGVSASAAGIELGSNVVPALIAASRAPDIGGRVFGGGRESRYARDDLIEDERAEAEAHHDHSARQAAPVGEPLGDGCHWGDVCHSVPEAADDSVGEVHPPCAEGVDAEAS